MSTIPDYPAPSRALTGEEPIAAWQDGKQIALPVEAVISAATASAEPAVAAEVASQVNPLVASALASAGRAEVAATTAGEAAGLVSPLIGSTQTLGCPYPPVAGNAFPEGYAFVQTAAISTPGYIKRLWAHSPLVTPQIAWAGMWRVRDDRLQLVGPERPVTLTPGANVFDTTVLGIIPTEVGDHLGIRPEKQITYADGGYPGGYYQYEAGRDSISEFKIEDVKTFNIQFGCEIAEGKIPESDASIAVLGNISNFAGYGTQVIGRSETPITGTPTPEGYVFLFASPAIDDSVVEEISAFTLLGGTIIIKRASRSENTFTESQEDHVVTLKAGPNLLTEDDIGFLPVNKGDRLGYYPGTTAITFVGAETGETGGKFYQNDGSGNSSSFTDANVKGGPALQLGFKLRLGQASQIRARLDSLGSASGATAAISDSIGDLIEDATIKTAGLNAVVTTTINRAGDLINSTGSVTLTPPSAGSTRYDIIGTNMETQALVVVAGVEKSGSPSGPGAGIPKITDSRIAPLFLARVNAGGVSTLPSWRLYDGTDMALLERVEIERQRSRRLIPKTRQRIIREDPVRIVIFADSIGAQQMQGSPDTAPNGFMRDRATADASTTPGVVNQYLREGYSSADVDAFIAANPLQTSVQLGLPDDGAGAVHTRLSWGWRTVAGLERLGHTLGGNLFRDNWSIAGQSTAGAVFGNGADAPYYATAWLERAIANAGNTPTLFVIALGTNERGDPATEGRLTFMINLVKAAGIEVVVLDVPRPRGPVGPWAYTSRVIRRVAYHTNVAYVPFWMTDDRYLQGLGVTEADLGEANGGTHPGLVELPVYDRELERMILGS